jgi:adenine-specific DNA-methyltransferase
VKYNDLSKEELLRLIEARDRRDATRFGLIWEADAIERDKALNNDFVALDLVPELCVGSAPWRNLIIEGDNYDVLRYLRMTLSGRVKCILVDPPYNTGSSDFIYNDRFVDKEHAWRHSMWLEYMYQRFTLARDLLAEDGVMLVHINEEEVDRLGCLIDRVFPGRKVAKFVWRTRSGARVSKDYFVSIDHEYVLCYANKGFKFAGSAKSFADYSNPDNDPRGDWANFNLTKGQSYKDRPRSYYPIQNPATGVWYPCNPDRVWAFSSETRIKAGQRLVGKSMEQVIKEDKVLWPKDDRTVVYRSFGELTAAIEAGIAPRHLRPGLPDLDFWIGRQIGFGMPRYKMHKSELDTAHNPLSTWLASTAEKAMADTTGDGATTLQVGYTAEGASLLTAMLGTKDFSYPKPLSLAQALVQQTTKPGDIVLDFFGGSGTTAHAVLAQNAEDEGNRRFILVSTTEATADQPDKNVCRDITQKRVAKAITGYSYTTKRGLRDVPGLGGDFAYLRSTRIRPGQLLEIEHAQVWIALQLAKLDCFLPYESKPFLWTGDADSAICYVPRFRRDLVSALRRKVKESAEVTVYSWQPQILHQHFPATHVSHLPVSETLTRWFGLNLTLSPA